MKNRNYRKIYRSGSTIKAQTIEGCSPMTIATAIDEDAARDIIDALEKRQHTKDMNDYYTPLDEEILSSVESRELCEEAFEPCKDNECYDGATCNLDCYGICPEEE